MTSTSAAASHVKAPSNFAECLNVLWSRKVVLVECKEYVVNRVVSRAN